MIKQIFRNILRSMGVTLLRGEQGERIRILGNATLSHTPDNAFGFLLNSLQQAGEIETVLQIGANDGIHCDQITPLVTSPQTRCILVEPNPEAFQRLSHTHRESAGVSLENVAVSTCGEHSIRLWTPSCTTFGGAPTDLLMSSDRMLLERSLKRCGASTEVRSIEVPAVSSRSLLEKHEFATVDLLVVDTEGADAAILLDYPFDSHAPKYLLFEHCHLPSPDFTSLIDFLARKGFRFLFTELDALAFGPSARYSGLLSLPQDASGLGD